MDYGTDKTICHIIRRNLKERRMVQKELGRALGLNDSHLQRLLNPDDNYCFRAGLVPDLCEVLGREVIEYLAEQCGGQFVPNLNIDPARLCDRHYAELVKQFGDLMRDLAVALDPEGDSGEIVTPEEASVVLRDLLKINQLVLSLTPYFQTILDTADDKGGKS